MVPQSVATGHKAIAQPAQKSLLGDIFRVTDATSRVQGADYVDF